MTSLAATEILPEEMIFVAEEKSTSACNVQPLGVIEHLKEQFGDYSDPNAYDWTWRETE